MRKERKWRGASALEEAVEGYFRSISRTVTAQDKDGPILNDDGVPIRYREYVVSPTVLGLCDHLGISRDTWEEFCDPRRHPEFRGAASLARERMQDWSQRALLTRKDVRGLIYILQNSPELNREAEQPEDLSLSARRALLEGLEEGAE